VQNSKSGLGFEKPEKIGLVKCVLCEKVFNNAEQLVLHAASKKHRTAARKRKQTPKPGYEMLHLFRESTVDQHKADAAKGSTLPAYLPNQILILLQSFSLHAL